VRPEQARVARDNRTEPIEFVSECVGMANAMSSFNVSGDAVCAVDKAVGVNYAAHGRG